MQLTDLQWEELRKAIDEIQYGTIQIKAKGGSVAFVEIVETKRILESTNEKKT